MTDVIADLPPDDRPRERLLTHGPETLSDAELVAILLGSGVRGKNAIQLARELLGEGMSVLRSRDVKHLEQIPGVGPAKAARISAAFEMSRRSTSGVPEDPPAFDRDALGRSLVTRYGHQTQERLGAVFLDSRQRILRQKEIYVGTINSAMVSTRDVISLALLHNALGVVAFHNHPSGNPTPSAEDLAFTRKLEQSLALVDVELIDHLIVGSHRYWSMRERGQI